MRSIILLLITIGLLFSCNFAQQGFVTFSPKGEEFSVKMPAKPMYYPPLQKEIHKNRFYKLEHDNKYFFIDCNKNLAFSGYKSIIKVLENNIIRIIDNKNKHNDGEYLKVLDSEGFYQTILTVNRPNRFYIFHLISREENDKTVENFFETLKFKSLSSKSKDIVKKITKDQQKLKNLKENRNFKSLEEIDFDNRLLKTEAATKDSKGPTASIKILSTVQPGFTEIARDYYFQGKIRLKVVFLRNGQIGNISPDNYLPLGLTNLSLIAARKIKFQPAQNKGIPYSVTKTVVFNYNIL